MIKKSESVILAIETGISGGSISLLRNGGQIDFWIGNGGVSRSEDVLQAISTLLSANEVLKPDHLVISEQPGGLTGLRIGIATALGLKNAFQINVAKLSILESMARVTFSQNSIITAVPLGRINVAWMRFADGEQISVDMGKLDNLLETLNETGGKCFVHQELFDKITSSSNVKNADNVSNAGRNLALYLGKDYFVSASDNAEG